MELCNLKTDEMNTARAQFMKIYNIEAARQRDKEEVKATLKSLPGNTADAIIKRLAGEKSMQELLLCGESESN